MQEKGVEEKQTLAALEGRMKFSEVVAQALAWLQREGRVSYRALKIEFDLTDDHLDALKEELIEAKRVAVDEGGKVLVWTGDSAEVRDQRSGQWYEDENLVPYS